MTITNEVDEITYVGNGSATIFTFPFLIYSANDLEAYIVVDNVETVISSSNYTVTGVASPTGGSVTYPLAGSPIAAPASIRLRRSVSFTQQGIDLTIASGFDPAAVEREFDLSTMRDIQIRNDLLRRLEEVTVGSGIIDTSRTLRVASGETALGALPNAATRANKFLGFNALGVPQVVDIPANATVFKTRTLAIAATIAGTVDTIYTEGYAAVNDFGGARYIRNAGAAPSGAINFTSADGTVWVLRNPGDEVWLEQAGAVANIEASAAANVTAINAAFAHVVTYQTSGYVLARGRDYYHTGNLGFTATAGGSFRGFFVFKGVKPNVSGTFTTRGTRFICTSATANHFYFEELRNTYIGDFMLCCKDGTTPTAGVGLVSFNGNDVEIENVLGTNLFNGMLIDGTSQIKAKYVWFVGNIFGTYCHRVEGTESQISQGDFYNCFGRPITGTGGSASSTCDGLQIGDGVASVTFFWTGYNKCRRGIVIGNVSSTTSPSLIRFVGGAGVEQSLEEGILLRGGQKVEFDDYYCSLNNGDGLSVAANFQGRLLYADGEIGSNGGHGVHIRSSAIIQLQHNWIYQTSASAQGATEYTKSGIFVDVDEYHLLIQGNRIGGRTTGEYGNANSMWNGIHIAARTGGAAISSYLMTDNDLSFIGGTVSPNVNPSTGELGQEFRDDNTFITNRQTFSNNVGLQSGGKVIYNGIAYTRGPDLPAVARKGSVHTLTTTSAIGAPMEYACLVANTSTIPPRWYVTKTVAATTTPDPFVTGQWTLTNPGTSNDLTVAMSALPFNGGSAVTAIQYNVNGGAFVNSGVTTATTFTIAGLTNGAPQTITLRLVTAVGSSPFPGDAKTATPS